MALSISGDNNMNRGIPVLRWLTICLLAVCTLSRAANTSAQVTTGGISGVVTDADKPVAGASIIAIHEPSGTTYDATTRADGRFSIQGMRVGGPYSFQRSVILLWNIDCLFLETTR
jgi:hypothetical protein